MYHGAKFRASRSDRCVDMTIFRFFKMAIVRHLGFLKTEILAASKVRRANI